MGDVLTAVMPDVVKGTHHKAGRTETALHRTTLNQMSAYRFGLFL
jgi:hypothetical protein